MRSESRWRPKGVRRESGSILGGVFVHMCVCRLDILETGEESVWVVFFFFFFVYAVLFLVLLWLTISHIYVKKLEL